VNRINRIDIFPLNVNRRECAVSLVRAVPVKGTRQDRLPEAKSDSYSLSVEFCDGGRRVTSKDQRGSLFRPTVTDRQESRGGGPVSIRVVSKHKDFKWSRRYTDK
jgi:hypothetical protein